MIINLSIFDQSKLLYHHHHHQTLNPKKQELVTRVLRFYSNRAILSVKLSIFKVSKLFLSKFSYVSLPFLKYL